MITFTTYKDGSSVNSAINPNIVSIAELHKESTLLKIWYHGHNRAVEYQQDQVKESLEKIYNRITGKSEQMIRFDIKRINDGKEKYRKIYLAPKAIISFVREPQQLRICFDKSKYQIRDLVLIEGYTKQLLDDIWQQLLDAKGIAESDV